MLQSFRSFMKSKFGVVVTLSFLVLIALAFASGDVANMGGLGTVSSGDNVAVVGDRKISASEVSLAASQQLDSAREQNPTLSMPAFLTESRMDELLDQVMLRAGMAEYGEKIGLRVSTRMVDSEILKVSAFNGIDGKFSADVYATVLRQQGLTDEILRKDFAAGLYARQIVLPAGYSAQIPDKMARRYASLLKERREGEIGFLPSAAFAPTGKPTDAQLQAYYVAHRDNYLRPERRVIQYGTFGIEAVKDLRAPTEAQIEARYKRDAKLYAATESRVLTQLVLPTEAAAKAVIAEIRGGKSMEAAAREKGLATASIGPLERDALTEQTSAAVASPAFSAKAGEITAPARASLGWYVLRVDSISKREGRSLAQVHDQIAATLADEQRRAALDDLSAQVDDELSGGGSLREVADDLGITLQVTLPLTGDGMVYGKPGERGPQVLGAALSTAFSMEEEEPQLAVLEPGKTFLVYQVTDITPSAAAPLNEIKDRASVDWARSEGAKAARAAADRILARVAKGTRLADAVKQEKVALPPVDNVRLDRVQLQQMGRVPPVLALFFSMAQGTSKKLESGAESGWFVTSLAKIEPGEVTDNDPILAQTRTELGPLVGEEMTEELSRAVLADLGQEVNKNALKALRNQLTGRTE